MDKKFYGTIIDVQTDGKAFKLRIRERYTGKIWDINNISYKIPPYYQGTLYCFGNLEASTSPIVIEKAVNIEIRVRRSTVIANINSYFSLQAYVEPYTSY